MAAKNFDSFTREQRYFVIKLTDLKGVDVAKAEILFQILDEIEASREADGKRPLQAVVVEDDWPEYEKVWKMIEDRYNAKKFET